MLPNANVLVCQMLMILLWLFRSSRKKRCAFIALGKGLGSRGDAEDWGGGRLQGLTATGHFVGERLEFTKDNIRSDSPLLRYSTWE